MTNNYTNLKTKGLKIFENDKVVFDKQKTEGVVAFDGDEWIIIGSKGHKWNLEDSIKEGITIITSFNQKERDAQGF